MFQSRPDNMSCCVKMAILFINRKLIKSLSESKPNTIFIKFTCEGTANFIKFFYSKKGFHKHTATVSVNQQACCVWSKQQK